FEDRRLDTDKEFPPSIGERGAPRRRVARRLFYGLTYAQRKIFGRDAWRALASGAMGALEPRPPQLGVAQMVPGAQPVAAVPYRQHIRRISGGKGCSFFIAEKTWSIQHQSKHPVAEPAR